MDAYEDIKSLGRGAFASVRLIKRKKDGVFFVVKRFHVPMSELTAKERQEIAQEVKLIAHLRHPNVIAFKENFVENGVMHIIMEYAKGGTLHRKIQEQEGELFPEVRRLATSSRATRLCVCSSLRVCAVLYPLQETVWEMFVQLVLALRYVHSCNILHRDLKSDNVMTSGHENRVIKLADFGIAKVLGSQADMAASIIGTPHYLSPELCQGQPYDHKSDIWVSRGSNCGVLITQNSL
jgi:serine/threonine protein kinase